MNPNNVSILDWSLHNPDLSPISPLCGEPIGRVMKHVNIFNNVSRRMHLFFKSGITFKENHKQIYGIKWC
jgi:hypothetical protein